MLETRADTVPGSVRRRLFVGLTVVLVVFALEGVAHLFHYAVHGEFYARGQLRAESSQGHDFGGLVTHPYFGYTTPVVHEPSNNVPPLLAHDSTLVVGLFGGSVARQVQHVFRERLAAFLIEEGSVLAPVVIDFAQGGMKQPQQVHQLAYMLAAGAEFDLVVNLDGHNDLMGPHYNVQRGVFPSFPYMWDKRVGASEDDKLLLGRAILLERKLNRLRKVGGSVLGLSATVGFVLRRNFEELNRRLLGLNQQLLGQQDQQYDLETHGPRWTWYERDQGEREDAVRELAVQVWFRSSLVMANLAATAGADYFHFLQPSQYIAGSKPLTAEEMATAYKQDWSEINYAKSYPLVAERGAELRQAGVSFFDLTRTFADVDETIYIDTCCHVNSRGAQMLATRMVDAVKPAVRRRAEALAEARKSALAVARRPARPDVLVAEDYYDVHLRDGKWLVYRREACLLEDTEAWFFLHVTPNDLDMLPAERASYGFDNLDFAFAHKGTFTADGACVAQAWLPEYEFARILTGQLGTFGRIWEVEFDVPIQPEPAPIPTAAIAGD